MKAFLMFLFMLPATLLSQDRFIFSADGLTEYIVESSKDSLSSKDLYLKSINWIKETYNSPDDVIKTSIEDKKLRFEGVSSKSLCHYGLGIKFCFDVKYMVTLSFKKGKYKMEVVSLKAYNTGSQYSSPGWVNVLINKDASSYYKKNGKIKKTFRDYPITIETLFNSLNRSLSDYINGKGIVNKKDDW